MVQSAVIESEGPGQETAVSQTSSSRPEIDEFPAGAIMEAPPGVFLDPPPGDFSTRENPSEEPAFKQARTANEVPKARP